MNKQEKSNPQRIRPKAKQLTPQQEKTSHPEEIKLIPDYLLALGPYGFLETILSPYSFNLENTPYWGQGRGVL